MTVRSPWVYRWQQTWALAVPRARLGVGLTRRHAIFVAVVFYLGLLAFAYLHLLGQVAWLEYQAEALEARWATLVEENARLQTELSPLLSVERVAERSTVLPGQVDVVFTSDQDLTAQATPAATAVAPSAAGTYTDAWAHVFHLGGATVNAQSNALPQE